MRISTTAVTLGFITFVVVLLVAAGCSEESDTPTSPGKQADSREVRVEVSGMSCAKGCAPRAQKALASLPWASSVKVDFNSKIATFSADAKRYDEGAVLQVLRDEGFEGNILK